MKIGIDARMYGSGFTGIGRYNFELIHHLAEIDDQNEYIIFLRKEAYDEFEPPNKRFKKVLADYVHYSFAEQFQFLKTINSQGVDLMHFTHFNAPILYFSPYIVTIHDLTLSFYPGKKMNRFWYRMAYQLVLRTVVRQSKKIIAVSEHTKSDLKKLLGVKDNKIEVIYNGVNPEFAEKSETPRPDLMKKLGLQKPYFLYTGVWRDHKNIVGMIKAFDKMNKGLGGQYNLVITGRHNPSYDEIPQTIKNLGIEQEVHLVGLVDEEYLRGLYQFALAYVFPSFYEGFGLPPLEAMQCSTPVLASNRSSIPEICGEDNALFFDPDSIEEMSEKMHIIATDSSVRQRLVNRGLDRVKQFSWNKMTSEVLNLYKHFNEKVK